MSNDQNTANTRSVYLRYSLFAVVPLLVAIVSIVLFCWWEFSNKTIVRNSTGANITAVRLEMKEEDGEFVSREAETLLPGESMVVRHFMHHISVKLTYTHSGVLKENVESYADLWTGETWLINVCPGCKVVSDYEHSD